MKTLWKVFKKDLKSNNGNIKWEKGKWVHHKGKLKMCCSGLHASERVLDAMGYTNLEELALVEVKGKHLEQDDKQCWESMRIVELYKWTKKDSVSLAIFAAELVLDNYEKKYRDKAPREAIEAAKKVLKNDTEKNRSAARSARSAWSAAESAALSAAESAARSAAWSVESAWSEAKKKTKDKCEAFIQKRIKKLEIL